MSLFTSQLLDVISPGRYRRPRVKLDEVQSKIEQIKPKKVVDTLANHHGCCDNVADSCCSHGSDSCCSHAADSVSASANGMMDFIGNGGGAIYQSLSLGVHVYAAAAMLTTIFDFFGDGSEMKYLDNLSGLPIYITHASSDMPCPVKRSRMSYSRLKELGNTELYYHEYSDPELESFGIDTGNPVGSHYSAWLDYAGNDMFRWLFSYRKRI